MTRKEIVERLNEIDRIYPSSKDRPDDVDREYMALSLEFVADVWEFRQKTQRKTHPVKYPKRLPEDYPQTDLTNNYSIRVCH